MKSYANKADLKNEIAIAYKKYIAEFADIPEQLKDKVCEGIDRSPAQNLAYQVGWTTLLLKWELDERQGLLVKTPSDNFKWNELGLLYQWFNEMYAKLSLRELKQRLNHNIEQLYSLIDEMSEADLFEPHRRKWADEATKNTVWPVYKFIHINTVAPFSSFRSKIRKWKKLNLLWIAHTT